MSAEFVRKYNTATHVYIPVIKRGVVDFAVGADWTPAAGDVKVSKDGGAAANIGTLPVAIVMGNTAMWDFVFTGGEVTSAKTAVTVSDSATKAVEDTMFDIITYGNASAELLVDFKDAVRFGLTALPNAAAEAAGGLYTKGSGAGQINQAANGQIDVNTVKVSGTAQTARDLGASVLLSPGTGTGQISLTTGAVTVGTNNDKTGYTASTVSDKTGYALSGAGVQAIWDALTSALTTVGSIGKLLVDNINATIGSRLASASYTAPDNTSITAIKAKTDNLPASPAAVSDVPTANANADALLDRASAVDTYTPRGILRMIGASLLGQLAGAATSTITIKAADASKTRITCTEDANGNRTAITLDAT